MIPWWSTSFGERDKALLCAAIDGRNISQGKVTREFEERLAERLGVPYVCCTSSGTTALTMALMAAKWDYVRIPNRTWIATAHAAMMADCEVELSDVDERGLLPCGDGIQREIFAIPVHLNGRYASVCRDSDIEDSCQAFPKPPEGLMACYSMSTAKLLPTGQGGFVATRDEGCYKELKALRTHDVADAMNPVPIQWRRFGYNFRYNDLAASVGLAQLETLDDRIDRLHEIHGMYADGLPEWCELPASDGVPLYAEVLMEEPDLVREYLLANGIQARPFHPSLNTAPYLNDGSDFPMSKKWESGLFLPSGPAQTDETIERVIEVLHGYRG